MPVIRLTETIKYRNVCVIDLVLTQLNKNYMFVVFSRQKSLDTPGEGFIPLGLTSNPGAALSIARRARAGEYGPIIHTVLIYDLEENKPYDMSNFNGESISPTSYITFRKIDSEDWTEVFFDKLRCFDRRPISRRNKKASTGKFKAVVTFENGLLMQISDDVDTVDEAYALCLQVVGTQKLSFEIFNDRGKLEFGRKSPVRKVIKS